MRYFCLNTTLKKKYESSNKSNSDLLSRLPVNTTNDKTAKVSHTEDESKIINSKLEQN